MKKSILYVFTIILSFYLYSCSANPSSSHKKNGRQANELADIKIVKVSQLAGSMAVIKVKVLASGGSALQEAGLCWDTTGTPTVKASMSKKASQVIVGNVFSITLSNLKSNTTYHVRAYAKNKAGIAYSRTLNVNTTSQIALPHVKIIKPILVSNKQITIEGKLLNGTFTEVGFCWDTSIVRPTLKNSACADAFYLVGASNIFSVTMSNLTDHTIYHVRAYAINRTGVAYSDTLNITTGINWNKAANKSINAFNKYFYDSTGTNLYYSTTRRKQIAGGWIQAIYLDMVMDAYKRTGNDKYLKLINEICQGAERRYIKFDWGKLKSIRRWIYDDMLWWINSLARAYNITQEKKYLDQAKAGFEFIWQNAYNPQTGGIIWSYKSPGYTSSSNWTGVIAAVRLYKITGNSVYLTKAKKVYAWARKNLFEPSTGRVADNTQANAAPVFYDLPYDQGVCIGAALMLYTVTDKELYIKDAIAATNYTKNEMSNRNGIWNAYAGGHEQGVEQGILAHWVAELIEELDGKLKQTYADWLRKNANMVWSNSDPFRHLMGRHFTKPVPIGGLVYSYDASSGAELLQVVPIKQR